MSEYDDRAERAFATALAREAERFEPVRLDVSPPRRGPAAWLPVLVAAAAVLVLVVPLSLAALWPVQYEPGNGPATDLESSGSGTLPPPDPGWRYESFRDVVVQVPDSWGYASAPRSDWCVGARNPYPTVPFVDVTSGRGLVRLLGCGTDEENRLGLGYPRRLWATHLQLLDPDQATPLGERSDGEWTRIVRDVGGARISLLADAAHLDEARRVVESARVVASDQHGCPTQAAIQAGGFVRPRPAFDLATLAAVERIAVCQYELADTSGEAPPPGHPGLLASREIAGPVASAVLAALQAAPVGGGPDAPENCLATMSGDDAVLLRLATADRVHEVHVFYDWCFGNGFDDGTALRELTAEGCAPLWGGRVVHLEGSAPSFQRCRTAATSE